MILLPKDLKSQVSRFRVRAGILRIEAEDAVGDHVANLRAQGEAMLAKGRGGSEGRLKEEKKKRSNTRPRGFV